MKLCYLILSLVIFSSQASAGNCFECNGLRFGISGSAGATRYNDVYSNDGKSILGRLSLETNYDVSESLNLGLEIGVQNGNTLRLSIPKPLLDALGGEPVSVVAKPLMDALITLKATPFDNPGIFGFLKGGIAYRQLQVDRNEVNDLTKINPELQLGLGYGMTDNSALFIAYQHIFGSDPNYQINPLTETGHIENIPSQNSLFLGISILF